MSEEVIRRGTDQITKERVFRVLSSEIRISTNCPRIFDSLRFFVQSAHHDMPINYTFVYVVEEHAERYSILEQGKLVTSDIDADAAVACLFERIQEKTHEAMAGWVRIHSGCGRGLGKRFLVVGDSRAGKSTLMAGLLFSGIEVFCDDSVLLRNDITLPVPRKFQVRERSLAFLPRLQAIVPQLPFVQNSADGRVVAFDPQEFGFEWHITPAPVDTLFWLVPNHGRSTQLELCAKYRMAEQVMRQCNPPAQRDRNWVGDICAMVDRAATYNLHVGELEQGVHAVITALEAKTTDNRFDRSPSL
jgi:hypothetical protein